MKRRFTEEQKSRHGGGGYWFSTLAEARVLLTAWRRDYIEIRPHSAMPRIPGR